MNQVYEIDGEKITLRDYIIGEWTITENATASAEDNPPLNTLLLPEAVYTESLIDKRIEMLEVIGVGVDQLSRALYVLRTKQY